MAVGAHGHRGRRGRGLCARRPIRRLVLSRRAGRRKAVPVCVVAALTLLGALTGCTPSPSRYDGPPRPNIVFVLTDDLSTNLVRYMPHVEALERQGTSFSNYFVVDSLCCPSRSAIFTGQYPHDDGVFTNTGADGGYDTFNRFDNVTKTFGYAMHQAGYRTGLMGKYLNGYEPIDGQPSGWDEWDVAGDGYPEFDYQLNQDGLQISYGHNPSDYLTDVLSKRAGSLIDHQAASGSPFALEVATFAPHLPATPAPRDEHAFPGLHAPHGPAYDTTPTDAPPWLARFAPLTAAQNHLINRVYRKRVQSALAVDDLVAHLEQRIQADGLAKSTYFVFSSDNGFHTGEYRLLPGKQTAFDTDIKVPLVVTGPGVPAGHTVTALASSIDLAPTFEQLGHTTPTDRPDGVSLLPLLRGAAVPPGWQRAVLIEHHGPDTNPSDPDRQPPRAGDPPSYEAIRTATATYVEYTGGRDRGEREYYDLTQDPDELHNLASTAPASTLAALHRTLVALERCHGSAQCQAAARTG